MALGDDEGWADDERGLRCAECAEGLYCRAGVGNMGVVFCSPDQCSRNSYVDDNSCLISE
jgi:hypothetical protein